MAIPSFQDFMLPLLELLKDEKPHKMSDVREKLAEYFNLSEEDKRVLLPSGKQKLYVNRIGWATTYLNYAKLIEKIERGVYKVTERGLDVLKEKPPMINVNYLVKFPEFREFLNKSKEKASEEENKGTQGMSETDTPIETNEKVIVQENWGKTRARLYIEKNEGKMTEDLKKMGS